MYAIALIQMMNIRLQKDQKIKEKQEIKVSQGS